MALGTLKPIAVVSVSALLTMRQKEPATGMPNYVAIRQKTGFNETSGDAFQALFYPTPNGSDTVYLEYKANAVKLTATNKFPYGGAQHAETLLACCLSVAAPTEDNIATYRARMASSIRLDLQSVLGATGDPFPVSSGALTPYEELQRDAGIVMGFGSYPNVWDHARTGLVDSAIDQGLRQFYTPPPVAGKMAHQWSFMSPVTTLALSASDNKYDLPATYAAMLGPLTFVAGGTEVHRPVKIINEAQIREKQQYTAREGYPQFAAIRPKVSDGTADQVYEIEFHPIPDTSYTMSYRYQAKMASLTTSAPYPLGEWSVHAATISASVKERAASYRADKSDESVNGRYKADFGERLRASIDADRRAHGAENLGYNSDGSIHIHSLRNEHLDTLLVTHEGTLYD
jgi:hypothetical protein